MLLSKTLELLSRIDRVINQLNKKYGNGIQQEVIPSGSNKIIYEIKGVKSFPEYKDQILNMAICVWSLKDYIKEIFKNIGKDPKEVESLVNNDNNLQICADVANRAKHLVLRRSRSGRFPKIGEPNARIKFIRSDPSIKKIIFTDIKMIIDVDKAEYVDYALPVLDSNNNFIGNAEDILKDAFYSFSNLLSINNIL